MEIHEIMVLLFHVIWKLVKSGLVVDGSVELRNPESLIAGLGVVLLAGTFLYAVPKTLFIGSLLLVFIFILDGAIAANIHLKNLNLGTPYSRISCGYANRVLKKPETTQTNNLYQIKYQFILKFKN